MVRENPLGDITEDGRYTEPLCTTGKTVLRCNWTQRKHETAPRLEIRFWEIQPDGTEIALGNYVRLTAWDARMLREHLNGMRIE